MSKPAKITAKATVHAINRLRKRCEQFSNVTTEQATKILELTAYLGEKMKRVSKANRGKRQVFIRNRNLFNAGEDIIVVCTLNNDDCWVIMTVYTYEFYIENRRKCRKRHKQVHRKSKEGFFSKVSKRKEEARRFWRSQ